MSFLFFIKSTIKHTNFVIKELVNLSKMDLSEQLKKLFPDHQPLEEEKKEILPHELFVQKEPMICKYEKRKGKPTTIISGYEGEDEDFKILAKEIKSKLAVGGTFKDGEIIIQGDYRDKIMKILQDKGFKTKRVGG
ncbi:translation initiation factor 1 [Flavobacterium cheniae]|jgi:translation initiation factor 1|uniref:Translation initiation factor 1 n=2 Tax=Flavobacterium cheniae TaxID=295428 RepID=A0A562KSD5_9FLAO|nr:translation initiation factor 1 (eIF-1/SUI1) [Flavobacterium cheniae]TWH98103.1 translation initiation factor 1 [Flavobacterium cheniae]